MLSIPSTLGYDHPCADLQQFVSTAVIKNAVVTNSHIPSKASSLHTEASQINRILLSLILLPYACLVNNPNFLIKFQVYLLLSTEIYMAAPVSHLQNPTTAKITIWPQQPKPLPKSQRFIRLNLNPQHPHYNRRHFGHCQHHPITSTNYPLNGESVFWRTHSFITRL